MRWPWKSNEEVDKATLKIVVEDNERLKQKVKELQSKLNDALLENDDIRNDMRVRKITNDSMTKPISNDNVDKLIKENKQLKGTLKSYQTRLKTYRSGLIDNDKFESINSIKDSISKFLSDEEPLFVKYVKDPLDKAGYYEYLATRLSITFEKELKYVMDKFKEIGPIFTNDTTDFVSSITKELYSRSMYRPFVRRSIAMNNKTKELLTDIQDKLDIVSDEVSKELIDLRLENKKLKDQLLQATSNADTSEELQKLRQEISNLRVENEALRYKKKE